MAITKITLERASAASLRAQSGIWRAELTIDSLGAAGTTHAAVNLPRKFRKGTPKVIAVHIPAQGTNVAVGAATFSANADTITLTTSGGPSTPATNVIAVVHFEAENP
jgi:hypothetical protein